MPQRRDDAGAHQGRSGRQRLLRHQQRKPDDSAAGHLGHAEQHRARVGNGYRLIQQRQHHQAQQRSGNALQFTISGTVNGATVTLYQDGNAIGSATASGTTTTISPSGTILDGTYTFTAKQAEVSKLQSGATAGLSVTIDTVAPTLASPSAFAFESSSAADRLQVLRKRSAEPREQRRDADEQHQQRRDRCQRDRSSTRRDERGRACSSAARCRMASTPPR